MDESNSSSVGINIVNGKSVSYHGRNENHVNHMVEISFNPQPAN